MVEAIVLGLDALDSDIMKQYLIEGILPTFRELMEDGELTMRGIDSWKSDHLDLPHTPQAWTCIYTGGDADYHGVTTGDWRQGSVNFVEDVPSTIFDDVSYADLTAHSFRMAMTWPARDISGWMTSGFPSGQEEGVADSEVWGIPIRHLPDDYADQQDHWVKKQATDGSSFIDAEHRKYEITKHLIDVTEDPDVLFWGTQLPDKMAHWVTDYAKECETDLARKADMRRAYQAVDEILGKFIDDYDPEVVIGISDHGFQRHYGGHSMRSTIFEYSRTGVDDSIDTVDDITDFRDYFCTRLGVERQPKHARFNGSHDSTDEITEEEKESMEKRLEDMGYL